LFLREAQLSGPDYRLGPPLDLELPENALIVPLDGAQGDEKPVRDLLIRESFGDEPEDFHLALLEEEFLRQLNMTQKQLADHHGCDVKVVNHVVPYLNRRLGKDNA